MSDYATEFVSAQSTCRREIDGKAVREGYHCQPKSQEQWRRCLCENVAFVIRQTQSLQLSRTEAEKVGGNCNWTTDVSRWSPSAQEKGHDIKPELLIAVFIGRARSCRRGVAGFFFLTPLLGRVPGKLGRWVRGRVQFTLGTGKGGSRVQAGLGEQDIGGLRKNPLSRKNQRGEESLRGE